MKTTTIVTLIKIVTIMSVHLIRVAIGSKTVEANNVSKEDGDALEVLTQVLIRILKMMMMVKMFV